MRLPMSFFLLLVSVLATAAQADDKALFQSTDYQKLEDTGEADRRFYVSGIMGGSFATLTIDEPPSINRSLFTAGAATGVAFSRPMGQLRLEFEGRYRDPVAETVSQDDIVATVRASNGWSTMVNAWRDLNLTEHLGVYAGGGIGAGGYSFMVDVNSPSDDISATAANGVTSFAWQAGGGVIYELTKRVTLDLGYRFYSVGAGTSTLTTSFAGFPVDSQDITSRFSASELLFSVRIYEPFRGWR